MTASHYVPAPFLAIGSLPGSTPYSFTEFTDAVYTVDLSLEPITASPERGWAHVEATIKLKVASTTPVFPVLEFTSSLASNILTTLDGNPVAYDSITPLDADRGTKFFAIKHGVVKRAADYELVIDYETELRINTKGSAGFSFTRQSDPGAYWHFRMSDGRPNLKRGPEDDSNFLGRYLPTNLEFDQHPRAIDLTFEFENGATRNLSLFTNGTVAGQPAGIERTIAPATPTRIQFPDVFHSSSIFFYLADSNYFKAAVQTPTIGSGQNAKQQTITILGSKSKTRGYPSRPVDYVQEVTDALTTLGGDFGPFKHDAILMLAGRQGMEYAGAAEIAGGNVLHELFHLHIGRFVCPANGPSGWWDESIAHWYVNGKNAYEHPPDTKASIGSGPAYRRWTAEDSRTIGAMLIGHLHWLLINGARKPAGFVEFIRHLLASPTILTLDTNAFRAQLEGFANPQGQISYAQLFNDYVD